MDGIAENGVLSRKRNIKYDNRSIGNNIGEIKGRIQGLDKREELV